jgi:hypothetical protein
MNIIKMDKKPRNLFPEFDKVLLHPSQLQAPSRSNDTTPHYQSNPVYAAQRFPVNNLAPLPEPISAATPLSQAYVADDDLMEWEPTTSVTSGFKPTPRGPTLQAPQGPSPFYGRLPPAPISQAHRLRNPPNKIAFRSTPDDIQKGYFNERKSAALLASEQRLEEYAEPAPAQLVLPQDVADTGLESLFDSTFQLTDQPPELVRAYLLVEFDEKVTEMHQASRGKITAPLQFLALCAWMISKNAPEGQKNLQMGLRLCAMAACFGVSTFPFFQEAPRSLVDNLMQILCAIGSTATIGLVITGALLELRDLVGISILGALLVQEAMMCRTYQKAQKEITEALTAYPNLASEFTSSQTRSRDKRGQGFWDSYNKDGYTTDAGHGSSSTKSSSSGNTTQSSPTLTKAPRDNQLNSVRQQRPAQAFFEAPDQGFYPRRQPELQKAPPDLFTKMSLGSSSSDSSKSMRSDMGANASRRGPRGLDGTFGRFSDYR